MAALGGAASQITKDIEEQGARGKASYSYYT